MSKPKVKLIYTESSHMYGMVYARLKFAHWPLIAGLPLNIYIKIGQVRP